MPYIRSIFGLQTLTFSMLVTLLALANPSTTAETIGEFYKPGSGYFLGYLTHDPQIAAADYPDSTLFLGPPPMPTRWQGSWTKGALSKARYRGKKSAARLRRTTLI